MFPKLARIVKIYMVWQEACKIFAWSASAVLDVLNSISKHLQISREFADNWSRLPPEEHVPLSDYMMALAVKNITT